MYRLECLAMARFIRRFLANEVGATAIEYGLIVALIAVFIIGAVSRVGSALGAKFNSVAASI